MKKLKNKAHMFYKEIPQFLFKQDDVIGGGISIPSGSDQENNAFAHEGQHPKFDERTHKLTANENEVERIRSDIRRILDSFALSLQHRTEVKNTRLANTLVKIAQHCQIPGLSLLVEEALEKSNAVDIFFPVYNITNDVHRGSHPTGTDPNAERTAELLAEELKMSLPTLETQLEVRIEMISKRKDRRLTGQNERLCSDYMVKVAIRSSQKTVPHLVEEIPCFFSNKVAAESASNPFMSLEEKAAQAVNQILIHLSEGFRSSNSSLRNSSVALASNSGLFITKISEALSTKQKVVAILNRVYDSSGDLPRVSREDSEFVATTVARIINEHGRSIITAVAKPAVALTSTENLNDDPEAWFVEVTFDGTSGSK
jgi:hypothetical protein